LSTTISSGEPEIDLVVIVRGAWKRKYLVASITGLLAIASVVWALTTASIYRADVTVTEVSNSTMNAAIGGNVLAQLGGLASIAGLNLGGTSDNTQLSHAVLKSRYLVEEFIERNDLIPELFKGSKEKPTLWLAVRRFQEGILRISEDTRQRKITVSVDWTDPEAAARWANGFVSLANELVRTRALDDAGRNVAYLTDQIEKTNVVELQKVMYNLIENETKTLMLANARSEYAFVVVDPATVPERRVSPNRRFIVLAGTAAAFFAALAIAFALDWWEKRRAATLSP